MTKAETRRRLKAYRRTLRPLRLRCRFTRPWFVHDWTGPRHDQRCIFCYTPERYLGQGLTECHDAWMFSYSLAVTDGVIEDSLR